MIKVSILSIGKVKERWLQEAIKFYHKRLQPAISLECLWVKDFLHAEKFITKESCVIGFDPNGDELNSESFCDMFYTKLERGGSRLTMVIGDAYGLPPSFKNRFPLFSLSRLTFTHQMTRLILIEQIYRASEIKRGSPYHHASPANVPFLTAKASRK